MHEFHFLSESALYLLLQSAVHIPSMNNLQYFAIAGRVDTQQVRGSYHGCVAAGSRHAALPPPPPQ